MNLMKTKMAPLPKHCEVDFSCIPDYSVLCLLTDHTPPRMLWSGQSQPYLFDWVCADGDPCLHVACFMDQGLLLGQGFHRAGLLDSRGWSWGFQWYI